MTAPSPSPAPSLDRTLPTASSLGRTLRARTRPRGRSVAAGLWLTAALTGAAACTATPRTASGEPAAAAQAASPAAAPAPTAPVPAQPVALAPRAPGSEDVRSLQSAVKAAIAQASPAVVTVMSRGAAGPEPMLPFGLRAPRMPRQGLGSGFVIDAQGHVVTNAHVVDGAERVTVRFADEREVEATIVGADAASDLAVLKLEGVESRELRPLELGSSAGLEVGDFVVAIGNPFGLPQTVSLGIVSAKGRANVGITDFEDFIQTDAAINPGNSGGPLVGLDGRVVGVNTAIASRSGGNDGVAFAIPADMARDVVDQLLAGGQVVRGQLGVVISALDEGMARSFGFSGQGILIQDVAKDSAGAKAGLRDGDIVTQLDGEPVRDVAAFRNAIARRRPGTGVTLGVWREGKPTTIRATLDARAGDPVAAVGRGPGAAAPAPKWGMQLRDATPAADARGPRGSKRATAQGGAEVAMVLPGSPAAEGGVRPGDVIERVHDRDVRDASDAVSALREHEPGKGVRLRLRRGDERRYVFLQAEGGSR